LNDARTKIISLTRAPGETLYGMRGLPLKDNGEEIARDNGKSIAAGMQGDSGAPFAFTGRWAVLVLRPRDTVLQFQSAFLRVNFQSMVGV
jgi:hypothetical protein